jgi:tripartite-type tricarboxylate transporter receptor subunit TctC
MKFRFVVLFLLLAAAQAAAQQTYPSKPIRLITGYAAGGTTTIIARLVGQKFTESWGQQVLVDNRPGGGTTVATAVLAKSPPDGYTIMLSSSALVLIPLLVKAPYDPIKDFAPVASIAETTHVLLLNPSVPANNLKEFIAYAKSRPGELNYATPGAGGSQHLEHEELNLLAGIKTQHIPYKGSNQALTDLLGGQVQLYIANAITAIPHINSGKVKAIAVSGEKRSPALPNVPTFEEAGLSGFSKRAAFYCIIAPAGTPKPIVDKLSGEMAKYLAQPDFREMLIRNGLEPFISTPEQLAALLKEGMALNADIIKKANIKFEN